jgi:nucleotide-binding universal stress UspA family protein
MNARHLGRTVGSMLKTETQAGGRAAGGRHRRRPVFASVVCGIDDSPASLEAVGQAAVLAGPGATLELAAVTSLAGHTLFPPLPDAAQQALAGARRTVQALGRDASVRTVEAASAAHGLLRAAGHHDLVVVGCTEIRTPLGVALGPVTKAAVEHAPTSVLVARQPPPESDVVGSILVAVDGSAPSHHATLCAARIAARHGSDIALVAAPARDASHVHALAEDVATVVAATGTVPVILDEHGAAARAIVAAAAHIGASMIVLGARLHTAGEPSVSADVARTAPCSVLIVREP